MVNIFLIVMVNTFAATVDFIACGNSRPDVFCNIGVLKNFAKLTGKYL